MAPDWNREAIQGRVNLLGKTRLGSGPIKLLASARGGVILEVAGGIRHEGFVLAE
jgi:hypothetical protein